MKKASLIFTILLICFALAACSQQDTGKSTDNTTTATEATSEETTSVKSSTYTSTTKSFSNKYGSSTTKCVVSGCNNYIASSGDTNCCTAHSNKCLNCKKYIDGDAMYCMDCIYSAASKSSKTTTKSYSNSSSGTCKYKSGGQYVCSKSATNGSYCKEHYEYLQDAYNSLFG